MKPLSLWEHLIGVVIIALVIGCIALAIFAYGLPGTPLRVRW